MILSWFIMGCMADSGIFMRAKTSQDIEKANRSQMSLQIWQHRCETELNNQWPPQNCFVWLNQGGAGRQQKSIEDWINRRCEQAVKQRVLSTDVSLAMFNPGPCREALRQAQLDRIYQKQFSPKRTELSHFIEIGREFETDSGHVRKTRKKIRRL